MMQCQTIHIKRDEIKINFNFYYNYCFCWYVFGVADKIKLIFIAKHLKKNFFFFSSTI